MAEGNEPSGSQIGGRIQQVPVNLAHGIVNGQDHKGQVIVGHSDENGRFAVHNVLGGKMKESQQSIQKTVVGQDHLNGQHPEHKVDPHGQNEHHDHDAAFSPLQLAENVGQRVGNHQTDHGAAEGNQQGLSQSL